MSPVLWNTPARVRPRTLQHMVWLAESSAFVAIGISKVVEPAASSSPMCAHDLRRLRRARQLLRRYGMSSGKRRRGLAQAFPPATSSAREFVFFDLAVADRDNAVGVRGTTRVFRSCASVLISVLAIPLVRHSLSGSPLALSSGSTVNCPSVCTTASERAYITTSGCETMFAGTSGL